MAAQVIPFTFQQHHPVRVTLIEDEPWFCLADVCSVLTVDRTSRLLRDLDEKGLADCHTLTQGGEQQMKFINEPNLYRVIFRSNKPEAKTFQDWVFNEVLPTIYKTGRYVTPSNARPDGTLISSEQQTLSEIVHHKAEVSAPPALIGKAKAEIWSRLHNKFRVSQYAQLPRTQLTDAILYVNAMELRCAKRLAGEAEPPKALPLDIHYPLESARPPEGCSGLSYYAFAQAEGWTDPNWELLMKLKAAGFNVDGPIYSRQAMIHVMTALYHGLIGKMADGMNVACASLPYAPIYLR